MFYRGKVIMGDIYIILRKTKTFIKIDSKTKFDFLYAYFYSDWNFMQNQI